MPTLLQIASLHADAQQRLDRDYTVIKAELPAIDAAWLAAHGAAIDGVVTGGHLGIPNTLVAGLPQVRVIGINGVGYDRVDLDFMREKGIRVSNTPDVLTDDVADLAIGLTLSLLRRLPQAHQHVLAGKWPQGEMKLARKLSGKRVGIIGFGRIGRAVAKRLGGFTDKISYTDRVEQQDAPFTFYPDAVALAKEVDILIVCAAASASTRKLVDRAVLEAIGPTGFLVNIARGSIVDEAALVDALRDHVIAGAALDVFEDEPNVPAALREMDNVVLTPHIASGTHETRRAMGELMLDNLDAFFANRPMPTPVV
ncbi:MAG: 2-hydroxyacid dehydrogenase [Pseudomonadota bacterium]|nr:2-hydroxyacid dehydrogenase [Pseudomonadota bacterium]